jgi:3-hydroxyisobutyrate dehydrogenase-like beta-hydroxyacid dehydrogenase
MSVSVGFIGLGDQGAPIAERILQAGFRLSVWARRPETTDPLAARGATRAPTIQSLAADCDQVHVCVRTDDDAMQISQGAKGLISNMQPGSTLLIHSTVAPSTCTRLATLAAQNGVALLDAPVSGGGVAAAAGRLLVMVGGDETALRRCLPVLQSFSDQIHFVGPVGAGQLLKLINNALYTANLGLAQAAIRLGIELGIEPQAMESALSHGSATSAALTSLLNQREALMAYGLDLLAKDVGLLEETAGGSARLFGGDRLLPTASWALTLLRNQDKEAVGQ